MFRSSKGELIRENIVRSECLLFREKGNQTNTMQQICVYKIVARKSFIRNVVSGEALLEKY